MNIIRLLVLLLCAFHATIKADWQILFYIDSCDGLSQAIIKNITDLVRGYNENPNKEELHIYIQLHCLDQDNTIGSEAFRYRVTPNGISVCDSAYLSYNTAQDLIDAARWAFENNSATHTMIIFSNHGGGIIDPIWHETECGGHWDAQEDLLMQLHKNKSCKQCAYKALMMMTAPRIYLNIHELNQALVTITQEILLQKKFDIIGMDMCLMSLLELAWTVAPYTNLYVSSQDASSSYGWDYYQLFKRVTKDITPEDLAQTIISTYDQFYQLLGDDEHTLAAVNLNNIYPVKSTFEKVCTSLQECIALYGDPFLQEIKKLRPQLYCFHLVPMYTDLHQFYTHFAECLKNYADTEQKSLLLDRMTQSQQAIDDAVIALCAGSKRSETHGLSIYFPLSHLDTSYPGSLFAQSSQWPDVITTIINNNI